MPFLKIQTNLPLSKKAERTILRTASTLVAEELDKPEDFVMLALQANTPMLFAGSDEPVAFLELKASDSPAGRRSASARPSAAWSKSTSASRPAACM